MSLALVGVKVIALGSRDHVIKAVCERVTAPGQLCEPTSVVVGFGRGIEVKSVSRAAMTSPLS